MQIYATLPFSLSATATNPEGGTLTYKWAQVSGPASASLTGTASKTVNITASVAGAYVFSCAVGDGLVTNTQTKAVTVSPYFVSTQSYTAFCGANTTGASVSRTASVSSVVSQADADSNALAAAVSAANAALRCDPVQGFIGWRVILPSLANFAGVATATYSVQLRIAVLTGGTPLKPISIAPVASPLYTAGSLPNNIADLSSYFAAYSGAQTFYLWATIQLVLNGVTTITQLPSSAVSLDYATPVGSISGATVRFRDVETPFTTYQGYASAYALTVGNTGFSAVQMTLHLSNTWDTFSLNLHGWDNVAYGVKPGGGYDRLVLSVLTGTAAAPLRDTVLDVRRAAYNLNDPYDFALNRLSYTPYFNGAQGSANYVLRRARLHTDGSLVYDANETGFRFESSLNEADYTTPGLSLPGATIGNLAENDAASITAGTNVAVSFNPFPGNPVIVAFPLARFTLSAFKWRLATDIYTHVVILIINGTPALPVGIGNQYAFPLGDPAVLDGPNNLFLSLAEFNTLLSPTTFRPFSAVFYAAIYNPAPAVTTQAVGQSGVYTIYPNSFPLLNNPRTINGAATYTISNFPGFQAYPASNASAISFTGNFAFGETLYHARVNGGNPFTL
jgi:hypothetical protein